MIVAYADNVTVMPLLFTLSTEHVRLLWRGPSSPPGTGVLRVEPGPRAVRVRLGAEAVHHVDKLWTTPFALLEETTYTVEVQSLDGQPVTLHHRDPVLLRRLAELEHGRLQYGEIRFGSQVGTSRFSVLIGGQPEVTFEVAVRPAKVSEADVEAMREDLVRGLSGLGLGYLRATLTSGHLDAELLSARPVWLALLRQAMPELERALHEIAHRPRTDLERKPEHALASSVLRPDRFVRRSLARAGIYGQTAKAQRVLSHAEHVEVEVSRITLDTPAHRWLKGRIGSIIHRVAGIRREVVISKTTGRTAAIEQELAALEQRLRVMEALPPLDQASQPPPMSIPLPLHTVAGYAEARDALLRLEMGASLAEGDVRLVPHDLATLYELWCVFTVAKTVGDVLDQPLAPSSIFAATAHGVRLRLQRGRAHAIHFEAKSCAVHLAYEPRFGAPPGLLAQRPDLLLTVTRNDHAPHLHVLDAKYRRDDSVSYQRRHGMPGPPEDALGALHRYRDAIVVQRAGGVERPVISALALFPWQETISGSFGESRLWASIESLGVGALPLLPGNTEYLRRWLRHVLL